MTIQNVKRAENNANYAGDEKENNGNTANAERRQRSMSNENIGMR